MVALWSGCVFELPAEAFWSSASFRWAGPGQAEKGKLPRSVRSSARRSLTSPRAWNEVIADGTDQLGHLYFAWRELPGLLRRPCMHYIHRTRALTAPLDPPLAADDLKWLVATTKHGSQPTSA